MRASHFGITALVIATLAFGAAPTQAEQRARHRADGAASGRAVPRTAQPRASAPSASSPQAARPSDVRPQAAGPRAYARPVPAPRAVVPPASRAYGYAVPRSYGHPAYGRGPSRHYPPPAYRYGYGYGYRPYGPPRLLYPAPYGYRPYGYGPGWNLSFYFGRPYAAYGYGGYGSAPAYGYYAVSPSVPFGALRIVNAPPNAQVFVDGYYAGVVDEYDGVFQHLNLEIGPHRVEIEVPGYERLSFDVRIRPGETITYRAGY